MALPSTAVFEIRATGSDSNGGFYNSARGGTDYSQQDSAVLSLTDVVTNGTTTATSVTGGFTSQMAGNGITIAGTLYEVTAVGSSTSVTLDRTATAASGQTGKVGGALANLFTFMGSAVNGSVFWVRLGTYTVSATYAGTTNRVAVYGYGTARGDTGRPAFNAGANSVTVLNLANGGSVFQTVKNVIVSGNGFTGVTGFAFGQARCYYWKCKAASCATGFGGSAGQAVQCTADTCTSGFNVPASYSYARSCTTGFTQTAILCLASGGTNGFNNGSTGVMDIACTAYNTSGDGFALSGNTAAAVGCLASNCGGYGFNLPASGTTPGVLTACAVYSCTSGGASRTDAFLDAVLGLTASPLVDPANGNFAINNVAGGGASCRAAGVGSIPDLTTTVGYPDIGAFQSQAAGGGLLFGANWEGGYE